MKNMPCGDCSKNRLANPQSATQFFPGLDAADTALTIAYSEVPLEHRENIDLMRQLIQKIRGESPRPSAPQWQAYFMVLSQKVLPYFQCPYCRRATEIDLVTGGMVHNLFQYGLYWRGLKLSIRRDLEKYWWMGRAFWHRLLVPRLRRGK
jgi:hypothetical protein